MLAINLAQRLKQIGEIAPDWQAIVYNDQTITYSRLDHLVDQLVGGLRQLGVKSGDRILISLPNVPEFVIAYYAALRMQAIVVPINPNYSSGELRMILADCQPAVAITTPAGVQGFEEALESQQTQLIITERLENTPYKFFGDLLVEDGSTSEQHLYADDDVVEFLYTSGTTSAPKAAMLTHSNLYSNAAVLADVLEMSRHDRILLVAPVYHAAAQTVCMNNAINVGATLVMHDQWLGPKTVLQTIAEQRITFFFGPPIFYILLSNYNESANYDLSSLRLALSGAAPLAEHTFKKFKEKYGIEIVEGYGLSETSPVVSVNPLRGVKKINSVGLPLPDVLVKVVDEQGNTLASGEIGELVVKGPNVMRAYYNKPQETAKVLVDGWFHTGDLGYIDEQGYIFIIDRKKDLIIRGGVNIYPREIEELLRKHPAVLEAAVVGVPDAIKGEEVKAFVVVHRDRQVTVKEIKDFLKGKIASFKIPRFIEFVESLPKNSAGKILKRKLVKEEA